MCWPGSGCLSSPPCLPHHPQPPPSPQLPPPRSSSFLQKNCCRRKLPLAETLHAEFESLVLSTPPSPATPTLLLPTPPPPLPPLVHSTHRKRGFLRGVLAELDSLKLRC